MAYVLDLDARLGPTARAAVHERLEKGAAAMRDDDRAGDPVEAVHEARKEVKKARALLRLVRPGLDGRTYRRENRTLRDASRTVAHVRDADVMVETIDALHERFAGQLPAQAFTALRERLAQDAEASRGRPRGELGAELKDALREMASRVPRWPLDAAKWSDARKGLARAYRRGRKAFKAADADPTTANLHEWRKRVKDLWYHERLLKRAWPAVMSAQADCAHALADLLGDDHDLAVLAERLREDPPTEHTDEILALVGQRREELLAQCRALGRRVYAEKPKPFVRRIKRYLAAP